MEEDVAGNTGRVPNVVAEANVTTRVQDEAHRFIVCQSSKE